MAYSDQVILQTIQHLIAEHGSEQNISYALIASASGASLKTVYRSIRRLIVAGQLIGDFTPHYGYRYRIPDGSTSATSGR